jgi:hypothetical protein
VGGVTTSDTAAGGRSGGLFISYRRGETSGQARALHDRLAQRFGPDRVYMDVDSIALGADFVQNIEQALDSSAAVLVLIGRDWMRRAGGEQPFDDPGDFIRLEVGTALRLGVPTIPILVERASMPTAAELPEELRPLARRHALELENGRWEYDVSRLVTAVEPLLGSTPEPTNEPIATAAEAGQPVVPEPVGREPVRQRLHLTGGRLAVVAVIVAAAIAVPIVLAATGSNTKSSDVLAVNACSVVNAAEGPGTPAPRITNQIAVTLPASTASQLAFYAYSSRSADLILAPKGWKCAVAISNDGGTGVYIYPPNEANLFSPVLSFNLPTFSSDSQAIVASSIPECHSCIAGVACPIFANAQALEGYPGQPCPTSLATGEEVKFLVGSRSASAGTAFVTDPPGLKGIVDGSGGSYKAIGMLRYSSTASAAASESCVLAPNKDSLCGAITNDFISRDWGFR